MDEAGIPMLVTMSQYKMGIKDQTMGVNQCIYTTGSTQWWPQWEAEYEY